MSARQILKHKLNVLLTPEQKSLKFNLGRDNFVSLNDYLKQISINRCKTHLYIWGKISTLRADLDIVNGILLYTLTDDEYINDINKY